MGVNLSSNSRSQVRKLPPLPIFKQNTTHGYGESYSQHQLSHTVIETKSAEFTREEIIKFLLERPEVLDEFVEQNVSVDRIKNWLKKKDPTARRRPTSILQPSSSNRSTKVKPIQPPKRTNKFCSIKRAAFAPREPLRTQLLNISTRFTDCDVFTMMKNVTNDAIDAPNSCKFICEISTVIAIAIRADQYHTYAAIDRGDSLAVCCPKDGLVAGQAVEDVKTGTSVACQAAKTREIIIKEELVISREPIDPNSDEAKKVKSTLCLPIIRLDGYLLGVVEFQRIYSSPAFTEDHFQVASAIICWTGSLLGLSKGETAIWDFRQRELNDFLLEVTRVIFDDIIRIDNLVSRIMGFAKHLVFADRCSFFLVDEGKQELYADLFDQGELDHHGNALFTKKEQIRFPITKGIAGYVATSGEVVNIRDAYSDERFNRDIDAQTGYQTKNILSMPIVKGSRIIGVVEMVNRTTGQHFTEADESSFRSFAVYCALALHFSILYSDLNRQKIQNQVALEQLSYHIQATEDEITSLQRKPLPKLPSGFAKCTFYVNIIDDPDMPGFVILMCKDLFELYPNLQFDMNKLAHFVLTVRKNYRPLGYHNWRHGFTVAHCMYWILKHLHGKFSVLEQQALFIGCLCHDLDHRGFNNSFMEKFDQPLSALYSTSVMEQHHYNMTITILQQKDHDIFSHLNQEQYKNMLEEIRLAIIATDLVLYFGNQKHLSGLIESESYSHENREHRKFLKAIMMTSCDLCAVCKTWEMQQETVRYMYAEFYGQGDEEKKRGLTPIPMMDRNNVKNIPNEQVRFLKFVCLPAYKNLADVFPNTHIIDLYNNCYQNCSNWEKLASENAKSKDPIWSVDLPNDN